MALGYLCATQLDEHWAVSVKHGLRQVSDDVIVDPNYDLVFFRRDAPAPVWRKPVLGESVTAYGFPGKRESSTGKIFGISPRACPNVDLDGQHLALKCGPLVVADTVVQKGYSGGPLVGQDGAVVGLIFSGIPGSITNHNIGMVDPKGEGMADPKGVAVAMPAEFVLDEWRAMITPAPKPQE
jgi:S1-C subfamily serine protease